MLGRLAFYIIMDKQQIISKFLKTSGVYFFGKVATYVVSFLMIRYYTNNVLPEEYGDFELLSSLYAVIIPFLFIEIWSGVLRFSINKGIDEQKQVISTSIIVIAPFIVLYTVIYFIICNFISIPHALTMYVVSLMFLFLNMMMMVSRAFAKNTLFAISGIIGAVANAITGYVCVGVFHLECEALLLAMIANYVIQIVFLVFGTKVWRFISIGSFSWPVAKQLIVFCLPFSINTLLYYLNTNYYRVVVDRNLGSDVLGIFVVGTKFCVIVTFVVSVFHLAWQELTFSQSEDKSRFVLYKQGLGIIEDVLIISTLAIIPLVKIIAPFFIGEAYSGALEYVPFYYVTIYFTSISGFLYNTLAAEKITVYHPLVKFFAAIAYLGIMYLFIKTIGIYAVIWGAVLSGLIEWGLLLIVCKKRIQLGITLTPFICFSVMYCIGSLVFIKCSPLVNGLYMIAIITIGSVLFLRRHNELIAPFYNGIRKKF